MRLARMMGATASFKGQIPDFLLNLVSKDLDLVRWQGVIQLKSGAFTLVREHFEFAYNAVIGQKMMF